jgi:hypothetical protein
MAKVRNASESQKQILSRIQKMWKNFQFLAFQPKKCPHISTCGHFIVII